MSSVTPMSVPVADVVGTDAGAGVAWTQTASQYVLES
jgi:hypothetical protein